MTIARHPHNRRGSILIVTMVLVFAMAALALTLGASARSIMAIAANDAASRQAAVVQRGAEQYVLALLSDALTSTAAAIETLDATYFQNVQIGSGRFWIVRPDYNDDQLPPFGLTDESAKLNLNTVTYEQLMRVPGMTNELAASIIDWRDEDSEVTQTAGAESPAYLGRNPGYEAKNAPFETVEELMLVNGMNFELLYGRPSDINAPLFSTELYETHGFFDLFTAWSDAPVIAPDGRQRLNVNGQVPPLRELVTEIIGGSRADEINGRLAARNNLFAFADNAGITADELARLEPYLMVGEPADGLRGRININLAPREVLLAIMEEALADKLIDQRANAINNAPGTLAWVMDALPNDAETVDNIVARGAFYSADIVAASGDGRAFRRARIVVDASGDVPVIVYRRDLTDLGWPLDPAILEALRHPAL